MRRPRRPRSNGARLFGIAMFDMMTHRIRPEAAIDKAFKRVEEIFANYLIQQA